MIRFVFSILPLLFCLPSAVAETVQVTALHPLLADVARQVGGSRVTVHDMLDTGGNVHRYEPRPADLKKMQESKLILASGKNLEPYLGRVRDTMKGATVVEVGRTIPSLTVGKDAVYSCCPEHATSAIDPHWWQSVENMRRATRVIAKALSDADPAGKAAYEANAAAYSQKLEQLKRWAASQLAKVPRPQRKLVTAHNAFAYFAKEFGFDVIAVAGLTNEQSTTPQELAKTIDTVKAAGVKAIFPERSSNDKTVRSIASIAGVKVADPLISDGTGTGRDAGFEGMIRHNVNTITSALGGE